MNQYEWNKNVSADQRIQSVQKQLRRYLPEKQVKNPLQPYIDYSERKKQGTLGGLAGGAAGGLGTQPKIGLQPPVVTPGQSQTAQLMAQNTSVPAPTLMRNPGAGAPYIVDPAQRQAQAMTGAFKTPAKPVQPAVRPRPAAQTASPYSSAKQTTPAYSSSSYASPAGYTAPKPKPVTMADVANPAFRANFIRGAEDAIARADAVLARSGGYGGTAAPRPLPPLSGSVGRAGTVAPPPEKPVFGTQPQPPAVSEPVVPPAETEPVPTPQEPVPQPTPQAGRRSVTDSLASYESQLSAMQDKYGGDIMNFDSTGLTEAETAKYMQDRRMYMLLKAGYDNAFAQLERQEAEAEARAQRLYTAQELLKKYLPETLKAQGLSDLGVSQSAVLEMNNNYQNHLSEVDTSKEEAARDVLDGYANQYNNAMLDNDEAKRQIDEAARQKVFQQALADAEKYYNDDYGLFNKQAILDKYKDRLSAEELGQLSTELDEYDRKTAADRVNDRFIRDLQNLAAGGEDIDWPDYAAKMKHAGYSQDLIDLKYELYTDAQLDKWYNGTGVQAQKGTYTDDGFKTGTYKISNVTGVPADELTMQNFDYAGHDDANSTQSKRVNKILQDAKNGTLKDGTVVDFNCDKGTDYRVYIGGKFYKVKKS